MLRKGIHYIQTLWAFCKLSKYKSKSSTAVVLCNRRRPHGQRQRLQKSGSFPKTWCCCTVEQNVKQKKMFCGIVTYKYLTVVLTFWDEDIWAALPGFSLDLRVVLWVWQHLWFRYNSPVSHDFDTLCSGRDFETTVCSCLCTRVWEWGGEVIR